jgi:hypothetical protein
MNEKKIRRCFVVYDRKTGEVRVSHPELTELGDFARNDRVDYDKHEAMFLEIGERSGCLLGAFVWRTNRGQAVRNCPTPLIHSKNVFMRG